MSALTLTQAKSYLRVGHSNDDVLIQLIVDGVEEWTERTFGLGLSETTQTDYLDGGMRALWPQRYPVISITSVYDAVTENTSDADDYNLRNSLQIIQDGEGRWEDGRGRWRVIYTGGYGTTQAVPAGLKLELLGLVARAYENRVGAQSESAAGWSTNFASLLDSDTMIRLRAYNPRPLV